MKTRGAVFPSVREDAKQRGKNAFCTKRRRVSAKECKERTCAIRNTRIPLSSNHSQSEKCSPTKGRVWRKLRKSSSPVLKRPETAQTRTTMSAGSGKRYDKPAPDVPFSPADRGSVSPAVPPALCRRDEIPDLRERFRQKFHVRMPSAQPDDDFPRVPNDSARYRE